MQITLKKEICIFFFKFDNKKKYFRKTNKRHLVEILVVTFLMKKKKKTWKTFPHLFFFLLIHDFTTLLKSCSKLIPRMPSLIACIHTYLNQCKRNYFLFKMLNLLWEKGWTACKKVNATGATNKKSFYWFSRYKISVLVAEYYETRNEN